MDYFYIDMGPKRLNKKKIIIVSAIIVAILLIILTIIIKKPKKDSTQAQKTNTAPENTTVIQDTSVVYYSNDKSISVKLPSNLNLEKANTEGLNYLLELRSDENLDIFISKKDIFSDKNFSTIVSLDQKSYLETFSNTSNLSELKELNVNGYQSYTYSFHYLDTSLSQAFYLQVIWIQVDNAYYIFDIEFPLDELSFYTNISTKVLSSFRTY